MPWRLSSALLLLLAVREPQPADGVFANAAEIELPLVFEGAGNLCEVARRVLQVLDHLSVGAETEDEAVTLRRGLQGLRQAQDDATQERMRHESVEQRIARRDQ